MLSNSACHVITSTLRVVPWYQPPTPIRQGRNPLIGPTNEAPPYCRLRPHPLPIFLRCPTRAEISGIGNRQTSPWKTATCDRMNYSVYFRIAPIIVFARVSAATVSQCTVTAPAKIYCLAFPRSNRVLPVARLLRPHVGASLDWQLGAFRSISSGRQRQKGSCSPDLSLIFPMFSNDRCDRS